MNLNLVLYELCYFKSSMKLPICSICDPIFKITPSRTLFGGIFHVCMRKRISSCEIVKNVMVRGFTYAKSTKSWCRAPVISIPIKVICP